MGPGIPLRHADDAAEAQCQPLSSKLSLSGQHAPDIQTKTHTTPVNTAHRLEAVVTRVRAGFDRQPACFYFRSLTASVGIGATRYALLANPAPACARPDMLEGVCTRS